MTQFYGKKNNATSKIADVGGIDGSTDPVTFNVTTGEGSKFPASNFLITIGNEILLCTSRTGDALTCSRAQEGTSIEAHPQNSVVDAKITAAQLVEHETLSKVQGMDYAADAGSTDDYAVTLAPAVTAYFTGMVVKFKANTANTGACTLNVNGIGPITIKKSYNSDLVTGDILANQIISVIYDGTNFQMISSVTASSGLLTTTQYAPRGFLINGKIVPSVASNNLTVAIKGMDGNDPSASNPVYVRIGDTVRTITAALSVTKNAGTNWFNSGGAQLATFEVDYFVYLGYNATDGVTIGFSRIPYAQEYSEFSTTSTNEKYAAISTITNAAAGDDYELIGRFAATLSAGAGYTWTVPTFSNINLIQRPIYETRELSYDPAISMTNGPTSSTTVGLYILNRYKVYARMKHSGTANGSNAGLNVAWYMPFSGKVATNFTAVQSSFTWTDSSTFTDGTNPGYWSGVNNITATFTVATRKPTVISSVAEFEI